MSVGCSKTPSFPLGDALTLPPQTYIQSLTRPLKLKCARAGISARNLPSIKTASYDLQSQVRIEPLRDSLMAINWATSDFAFSLNGNHYNLIITLIGRERKTRETDSDLESAVERGVPCRSMWTTSSRGSRLRNSTSYTADRQIVLVTGPRRSGKTTAMVKTIQELLDRGVNPKNTLYFSFDEVLSREHTVLEDVVSYFLGNVVPSQTIEEGSGIPVPGRDTIHP